MRRTAPALAALLLAACQAPQAPQMHPPLALERTPPLRVDVAEVQVVDRYHPAEAVPGQPVPVGQRSPTPPDAALAQWARLHFQPVGQSGTLQVIIDDASITETPLAVTGGLAASFTVDQDKRYDGRVQVALQANMPDRRMTGQARAVATRSQTTAENITSFQREQVWLDMTQYLIDDISARLDAEARQNLSGLVR